MDIDPSTSSSSRLTRLDASYDPLQPLQDNFVIEKVKNAAAGTTAFRNQYASIYFSRLMALKKRVRENAERKWKDVARKNPTSSKSQRVLDIKPGSLCFVVGTVYLEMRLKPNILEDIGREQHIAVPPPRQKFLSDDDEFMLEDESGRVRLVGQVIEDRKFPLVTGVIAAVLGAENQSGDFEVVDMCFAGLPPQPSSSRASSAKGKGGARIPDDEAENDDDETGGTANGAGADTGSDPYVAILSGLELGTNEQASDYRTGLLAEWLLGEVGSEEERKQASQIVRVVLAGNSMKQPIKTASVDTAGSSLGAGTGDKKPKKVYGYDSSTYSAAPTAQLDNFLAEVLETVDVDLMCGALDPVGITLPQQALHESLLPTAGKFEGFKRTTNPCWFEVAGRSFLGTSGQNVDDIFKYLESDSRLTMACASLEWSHMAPTAPDTLFCYPFQDRDPFILTRTPEVYFVGNQPVYESRVVESERDNGEGAGASKVRCRVVLVPRFAQTGEVVLLNCRTLETKVVRFE